MSALTKDRNTPRLGAALVGYAVAFVILAANKIYAGSMVVINTGTNEVQAGIGATASRACLGVSMVNVDNSDDGKTIIDIQQGIYRMGNKSGDELSKGDIGQPCYISDDQTVMKTAGSNPVKAGVVHDVDADGVWVDFSKGRI